MTTERIYRGIRASYASFCTAHIRV